MTVPARSFPMTGNGEGPGSLTRQLHECFWFGAGTDLHCWSGAPELVCPGWGQASVEGLILPQPFNGVTICPPSTLAIDPLGSISPSLPRFATPRE